MEEAAGEPRRTTANSADLRRQVLGIIRELALELHPRWDRTLIARPLSDLDDDLGYDSLGRAELLLRLNRAFGIDLPDQLIVEAATADDICEAVAAAAPSVRAGPAPEAGRPAPLPESTEPVGATTVLDVLAAHVRSNPERPHVHLWDGKDHEETLTYGALDHAARRVARGLSDKGVEPGDRVAIMLPTSLAFFEAFLGALMAGAVPVPIYPPLRRAQVEEHLRRQAGILNNAEAAVLVTDEGTRRPGQLLEGLVRSLKGVHTVAELVASGTIESPVPAEASRTALIQYTSGSTGDPKGVVLTHANLLANIRAMGRVLGAGSTDVFVSWLPLYHDMGLIGAWLGSLYFAAPTIIMSPLAFIAKPSRWLWAIHRHRATLSAAPNFGFELCLRRIADADIEGLDLSSLRTVVNGAEPVSASTIARFTERFARYGFAPEALAPVYGLAEDAVGLAFPPPGRRKPIVDRVERRALSETGAAKPASPDEPSALEIVACGQPLPGHQIRIVDATGREAPERHEGRLEFKGPSATRGYFNNPEKTKALFDGEWLDSGDLAYIAGGDVFLTGRVKDIIIRAAQHIYPQELEEHIGGLEGVRKGCVAVIAAADKATGTERLVVVAETRRRDPTAHADLKRRILDATAAVLQVPADEVVLAPPNAIPKTSSGKIRRAATRELYESGVLGRPERALWRQLARLSLSSARGRLARGIHTAAEFVYAGWWWSTLFLAAVVAWPLVVTLPRRRWRHAVVGAAIRALFRLTGTRFSVEQAAPLPERGAIIVVNHTSYLDGGVLSAAIEGPLAFVADERFGRQQVAGRFLRALGAVFVPSRGTARDLHSGEEAVTAALRAGERPVVFPEGRLRRMPGLLSFFPGPFVVAARARAPVVPVSLIGSRSVLRDGNQWFPRRGPVAVWIGAPIDPEGDDFEAALRLGERVRADILAHCGEPDLGREAIGFGGRDADVGPRDLAGDAQARFQV